MWRWLFGLFACQHDHMLLERDPDDMDGKGPLYLRCVRCDRRVTALKSSRADRAKTVRLRQRMTRKENVLPMKDRKRA